MAKNIVIDLKKYGLSEAKIALAFSGGRDSAALAYALMQADAHFFAVNVEHGIRGQASVNDSNFVAEFCRYNGITLKRFAVNSPVYAAENGLTLEQAARELRYGIFDGLLKSGECDYVALAHHSDDQVETVVMRALRGTGLKGLIAMQPLNGGYFRPFLEYSRDDIDNYIAQNDLQYVEDETNCDTTYTRNFLRLEIKKIKQRFPSFDEAVLRLSRNAAEAENFISALVPDPILRDGEVKLATCELSSPAVAKRLIVKAAALLGVFQDIEEKHLNAVLELQNAKNGKRIELPHSLECHKEEDCLVLCKRQSGGLAEAPAPFGEGEFERFGVCVKFMPRGNTDSGALYADKDKIPHGAVIRRRREGDRIQKFGGGSKSLGDYLTDKKIPLRKRSSISVIALGSEVYAVFGVDISEKVRIDEKTRTVAVLTVSDKNL